MEKKDNLRGSNHRVVRSDMSDKESMGNKIVRIVMQESDPHGAKALK